MTVLYSQTAIDILLESSECASPIKLILMDCQMPIMDGYEATRRLKKLIVEKKSDSVPIVALTVNDSRSDREMYGSWYVWSSE